MTTSASGSSRSKTEVGPSLSAVTTKLWPRPSRNLRNPSSPETEPRSSPGLKSICSGVGALRNHIPRSSYESDNVPWSKAVTCRAVRTMIGQELRVRYEVPQDLPHEMVALLVQLNEREQEE